MIRDKYGRALTSKPTARVAPAPARVHPQDPFGQKPRQGYGLVPVQQTRATGHAFFDTPQRVRPGVPLMLDVGVPVPQVPVATPVRPSFESARPTFARAHGVAPSPVAAMNVGRSGVDLRINAYRNAVAQPLMAPEPMVTNQISTQDPLDASAARVGGLDWEPKEMLAKVDRMVEDFAGDLGVEKKWVYIGAAVAALLALR